MITSIYLIVPIIKLKKLKTILEDNHMLDNRLGICEIKQIIGDFNLDFKLNDKLKFKAIGIVNLEELERNGSLIIGDKLYEGENWYLNKLTGDFINDNQIIGMLTYLSHNNDINEYKINTNISIMDKIISHICTQLTNTYQIKISNLNKLLNQCLDLKIEIYNELILFNKRMFNGENYNQLIEYLSPYLSSEELNILIAKTYSKIFKKPFVAQKQLITEGDILRRPKIKKLYGPWPIESIYFTTTQQNGIHYFWSPVHTMFSMGNISEKIRISEQNIFNLDREEIVLDLYAGIGYFSLVYAVKLNRHVIACEWNPYSIIGLVKGAMKHKLKFKLVIETCFEDMNKVFNELKLWEQIEFYNKKMKFKNFEENELNLLILAGNNEVYTSIYQGKANRVNLGLIPTSEQGYHLAVQSLNPNKIGYLHIHENVNSGEEEKLIEITLSKIQKEFNNFFNHSKILWKIELAGPLNYVKSYGPKIFHVVIDIKCTPNKMKLNI